MSVAAWFLSFVRKLTEGFEGFTVHNTKFQGAAER